MKVYDPQSDDPQPQGSAPRRPFKKATKAVRMSRINAIYKMRLAGANFADIREWIDSPEQNWGVSDRQVWRYIKKADALCIKYYDVSAKHLLSRHCLQRNQILAHAMGAGDYATALRALDSEAKLTSLFDAELIKRIEALEAAAASMVPQVKKK